MVVTDLPRARSPDRLMSMDTSDEARFTRIASALRELPPGQAGRTLDLLARMLALTDQALHERTGRELSRTSINHKRSGRSPMRSSDLWPLADALGVDVDVLLLPPQEAAQWIITHRREVFACYRVLAHVC